MVPRPILLCCCLLLAALLQGCATLGYYAQAVSGHLQLMARGRSIPALIEDPDTAPHLRERLAWVLSVRDFATRELALPDNGSYRRYSQLERPYVLWRVVAAPEFSVKAEQWCYPVVGCAAYRGYYAERDAQTFAERLARQGLDLTVDGVPAYSTLGWFNDPLPSTVIDWPQTRLAGLMFHELAHQRLYVKGDTAFNESFATAVERIGVQRWLEAAADAEQIKGYRETTAREDAFVELLLATRRQLAELYGEDLPPAEMRQRKQHTMDRLRQRYAELKATWAGYAGFDRWFERPVNNARLAAVAAYREQIPAFLALYRQAGGDLPAFYLACTRLGGLPAGPRAARLAALASEP